MKNIGYLIAAVAFISLLAMGTTMRTAEAASPGVVVSPPVIPPNTPTNFVVTAMTANTWMVPMPLIPLPAPPGVVGSIIVVDPNGDVFQLQSAGAGTTINLPDVGDTVSISYPVAGITPTEVPPINIGWTPGALAWVWIGGPGINVAPHTAVLGTYYFMFDGVEGTPIALVYFDVNSFLVIPESPLGTLAILLSSFAGIAGILSIRRYKWSS